MSKRVHFAPTNLVYSPIPATPSPTHSNSSLPSSSSEELSTPPPLAGYHPSPYPRSPFLPAPDVFPDVDPKDMHIHFFLAYTPYSDPALHYDVTIHPSIVEHQVSPPALTDPATQPPLQRLFISCPYHPPEWDIVVQSSSPVPGAFVSVSDVLNALYRGMRPAVHPGEYQSLSEDATKEVDVAYYTRCGRIKDPEEQMYEKNKGVKRVDFLRGRNRFMGLSATLKGADIWELNVS